MGFSAAFARLGSGSPSGNAGKRTDRNADSEGFPCGVTNAQSLITIGIDHCDDISIVRLTRHCAIWVIGLGSAGLDNLLECTQNAHTSDIASVVPTAHHSGQSKYGGRARSGDLLWCCGCNRKYLVIQHNLINGRWIDVTQELHLTNLCNPCGGGCHGLCKGVLVDVVPCFFNRRNIGHQDAG